MILLEDGQDVKGNKLAIVTWGGKQISSQYDLVNLSKKKVAAVSAPAGLHLVGLQAVSAQAGLDLEGLQHSTAGKRSLYQLCVLPWNTWNANAQVMGCIYKAMLV